MTLSIQQQIEENRAILRKLPIYCNFADVWNPETLSYTLRCVFQPYDTGTEIQNRQNS